MKIKMISKSILVAILTSVMLFITSIANYSNAGTAGFISFNNAPGKYITANDSKLADITVKIEDNNGISYAKLYKVDAKGNKKEIKFSSANTSNAKSHIYTMSHKNMLKGKEAYFYIEAKDKTGNILKSTFKVVVKSKKVTVKKKVYDKKKKKNVTKNVKETVKYYTINDSPRIVNWAVSGNNITVGIKDGDGTKIAKIQDMNNNNKEIYTLKNLAKGEARATLDMTKFKASNKTYKLKFITEDQKGYQSIRTVVFQMNVTGKSEAKKEITMSKQPNVSKINEIPAKNKKIKILFVGNSKTYINDIPTKVKGLAKAAGYEVEITSATQGGKTLKYLASNKKSTITKKAYDYVILQEQTDTYAKKYSTFLSGAKAIKKLVKDKNPNVQLIVRQTWVKKTSGASTRQKAYNNAEKVAKEIGASLVHDGKAFVKSRSTYGGINLYKDNTHQSSNGAYLSACCIFKTIFKQSPEGLSYKSNIGASNAKKLQQISNMF